MKIWIAGRYHGGPPMLDGVKLPPEAHEGDPYDRANGFVAWELHGMYSTKDLAIGACRDSADFIAALDLDVAPRHDEVVPLPECWYPFPEK